MAKKRRPSYRSPAERRRIKAEKVAAQIIEERAAFGYSPTLVQREIDKAKRLELREIEKSKQNCLNASVNPKAPPREPKHSATVSNGAAVDPPRELKPKVWDLPDDDKIYPLHIAYPEKYDKDGRLIFVEPVQAKKETPTPAEIRPLIASSDQGTTGSDALAAYLKPAIADNPRLSKKQAKINAHRQAILDKQKRDKQARQRAATTRRSNGSVALGATLKTLQNPMSESEQSERLREIGGGKGKYGRGAVKDLSFPLGGSPTVQEALNSAEKAARMTQEAAAEAANMRAAERVARRARRN